jgi:hypothetical protein
MTNKMHNETCHCDFSPLVTPQLEEAKRKVDEKKLLAPFLLRYTTRWA